MCQSASAAVRVLYGSITIKTCPVASRLLHHRPQMNVIAVDIRAPGDNQLCQLVVFGGRPQLFSIHQVPRDPASFGADRAVELASAQAVKETPVHRPEPQHADRPRIAVGQN